MLRLLVAWLVAGTTVLGAQASPPRLEQIRARGTLGCGIEPRVPGFSSVDAAGRHHGFDIDVCRAIAAAVLGDAGKVTFVDVRTVADFRANPLVDVVARRLTWELRRERPLGLLFGPITFHDGQSFLLATRLGVRDRQGLLPLTICVAGGTVFEIQANEYLGTFRKVIVESPHAYAEIAEALAAGRCQAYTGDVSDLAAIRRLLPARNDFTILPDVISKEPLAPLVRDDDMQWFTIVRWTVFALISAEELGISSANVDRLRAEAGALEVRRLLGSVPGNGAALGLSEDWAANAIEAVGNYGEIYERNLGRGSDIGLDRGPNRLWKDGGLMYAPPLR
ncbi:MAG: transporter substrate-binding domain-containing protein [Acidobacteria bacterium]|nr:transporter substrate-binding domain-containing protein [Acidobacteriota bacterium]